MLYDCGSEPDTSTARRRGCPTHLDLGLRYGAGVCHKIRTPFAELHYGVAHQLKLSDIQAAPIVTLHAYHETSEFMRGLHGPNPTEVYCKEGSLGIRAN